MITTSLRFRGIEFVTSLDSIDFGDSFFRANTSQDFFWDSAALCWQQTKTKPARDFNAPRHFAKLGTCNTTCKASKHYKFCKHCAKRLTRPPGALRDVLGPSGSSAGRPGTLWGFSHDPWGLPKDLWGPQDGCLENDVTSFLWPRRCASHFIL